MGVWNSCLAAIAGVAACVGCGAVEVDGPTKGSMAGGSGEMALARAASVPSGASARDTELCDGNEGVWLGYSRGSGGAYFDQFFDATKNPRGGAFLFVDGQCDYVARRLDEPLYAGHLDAEAAAALAARLHHGVLSQTEPFAGPACPDASSEALYYPGISLDCSCGCSRAAPPELAEALDHIEGEIDRLVIAGELYGGPVIALLEAVEDSMAASDSMVPAWPLETPVTEVPGLVYSPGPQAAQPVTFAGADGETLRALWQSGARFVRAAGGLYGLHVGEDLRPSDAAAVEAFLSAVRRP